MERSAGGSAAANVGVLVDNKLRPLGVLTEADGSSPKAKKLDPLLALNFRAGVIPERRLEHPCQRVHTRCSGPPSCSVVLAALVAGDVWLFGPHGVAQALRNGHRTPRRVPARSSPQSCSRPRSTRSATPPPAATAEASPGKMGCGLYLAWPAFYTDVTDAYRLGKKGRLRTDLGGVYLNVIVIIATFGLYFATGYEAILLAGRHPALRDRAPAAARRPPRRLLHRRRPHRRPGPLRPHPADPRQRAAVEEGRRAGDRPEAMGPRRGHGLGAGRRAAAAVPAAHRPAPPAADHRNGHRVRAASSSTPSPRPSRTSDILGVVSGILQLIVLASRSSGSC